MTFSQRRNVVAFSNFVNRVYDVFTEYFIANFYRKILDFYVVFLNPKHHPCDVWRSCCKVFLENRLQRLVVCLNSDASVIYIVVELLKTMYHVLAFLSRCLYGVILSLSRACFYTRWGPCLGAGLHQGRARMRQLDGHWFCTVKVLQRIG